MVGDSLLTLFWIVGITNAFNLLDNMDGLCAGTALIAGVVPADRSSVIDGAAASPYALVSRRPARRDRRLPLLQLPPGVDFHGRHRQPVPRPQRRRADAGTGSGDDRTVGRCCRSWRCRSSCSSMPIFDTTLVTVLRLLSGRRPSQGGRDHIVSSAGRGRPLRAQGGDDAVDARGCRRRHRASSSSSAPDGRG